MSVAAIAVGVVGAGAAVYAGSQQASAARSAARSNRQDMADTNALNYQMFREGRGEGGYSILPLYAQRTGGGPAEEALFADAMRLYDQTGSAVSPAAMDRMRALIAANQASQQAAGAEVGRLFSGARVNEQVANMQPVFEARQQLAQTRRSAALESLGQTINSIKAARNRQGFQGDSLAGQLVQGGARRGIAQQASDEIGLANLQSASDVAGLRNRDLDTRLQNLTLPFAISQQAAQLESLPENIALENQSRRLGGFNFFRIGPGSFQNQPMPQVQPIANTGQIVGQGVASAANTAAGMIQANQQYQQQQQYNQDYLNALRGMSGQPGSTILRS